MVKRGLNKFHVAAAAGLVMMALASGPASANHGHDYIAPLAAFVAFGALIHHSHYGHHGHYRHHRYHRPHYRSHRRHSHSHGGYRAPRHKYHDRW